MITHPKCDEHGCQVLRDGGHVACDTSCLRVADERATAAEQAASVDVLADPKRPALAFTSAQLVAEAAAQAGCDAVADNHHERALDAVRKIADGLLPSTNNSESPNAASLYGARDGIIDAWMVRINTKTGLNDSDAELYYAAWWLAAAAVNRIKGEATERSRL